ncbi:MAG: ATP-binding protein [Prolixibacteraceae bacterium]|nr:ATP-binding protein [Prolixibacteraceae bacterium]
MQTNPFKFGSVVDAPFFINRKDELKAVTEVINSNNHLVIISPRRFGKTSLVYKVLKNSNRKAVVLNLQFSNSIEDFAAQYLKQIYRLFPAEHFKQKIKNFRVLPSLSLNPVSGDMEISFKPGSDQGPLLEDVLNLLEELSSSKKRSIVVLDEFQEIMRIDKSMDRKLRSIFQNHKCINYVFLGSQESMMRNIFERKNSPFYHFSQLMQLEKIEKGHFVAFISKNLQKFTSENKRVANEIVAFTDGHPYYTQQLSFMIWNLLKQDQSVDDPIKEAIVNHLRMHDYDYERLWINLKNTEKKIISGLATSEKEPLTAAFLEITNINATSTVFSSLKRLMTNGFVIQTNGKYEIDDPFFKYWIIEKRSN